MTPVSELIAVEHTDLYIGGAWSRGSDSERIEVQDPASGEVIASVNQQFTRGSSLALSADGLTLAVVGHGPIGNQFSIFRLDAATRNVAPPAKGVSAFGTARDCWAVLLARRKRVAELTTMPMWLNRRAAGLLLTSPP